MPDREKRIAELRHFRCSRGHEFSRLVDNEIRKVLCLTPDPFKPCSRIAQLVPFVVPRPRRRIYFDDLPHWSEIDAVANIGDDMAAVTEAPAIAPATEIPDDVPMLQLNVRRKIVLE
jgi:hypothetical protein